MNKLFTRLIHAWDGYWLSPGSLNRLAIYRIWVFTIILIDVLVRTRGYLRYADVDPQFYPPSDLLRIFNIPAHPWLDIVYVALAIFVFLTLIGFKTNLSAVMASGLYVHWVAQWFSIGWVHHLHPPLVFSLMVLALSSSGARLSVDHLLKRIRENHAAQRFISKNKAADASPYATWPLRFVRTSVVLIFIFYLGTFITRCTFFEFLWFTWPVFFNFEKIGAAIRRHLTAPHGIAKFAVLFDGQCPLCIRSVTTVDFLDWRGKFVFRDVNDWEQISRDYPGLDQQKSLEEMQVMLPRENRSDALAGFYAFRKIAQHLPLGMIVWPFLFIPGVPFAGTRAYRFTASRRKRLSGGARCSFHACDVSGR
jgi:predicted DCC family thiol-disulfide oxidoreductase YuxK